MKKTLLYQATLLITLILGTALPITYAQNYTQFNLPQGAKARFGKGHIEDLTYSPDGTRLAVATPTEVWVYDARTGEELDGYFAYDGPRTMIEEVAYSPDGTMIASAEYYGKLNLWDANTGEHLDTLVGSCVAFSPDGTTIASGGGDKIGIWNIATGDVNVFTAHPSGAITSIAFSPDGTTIASGSEDRTIKLWNATSREHKVTLNGHTNQVTSVAFSPDGKTIASGSRDKTIRLWDPVSGVQQTELSAQTGWFSSVAFSPDGKTIATGSSDGTVRLWDPVSGVQQTELSAHIGTVSSVAFSPDGNTIATGGGGLFGGDGTIRLWDPVTGEYKSTLIAHTSNVRHLVFSSDGATLISGSNDDTIRFWDIVTGEQIAIHTKYRLTRFNRNPGSRIVFSPDGTTLAWQRYPTVSLWDVVSGEGIAVLPGHDVRFAFSPDGTLVASSRSSSRDIRIWNIVSGEQITTPTGWFPDLAKLAINPDGTKLVSERFGGAVQLWDVVSGEEIATLGNDGVFNIAFSPDGTIIATSALEKIRLWDAATGQYKGAISGSKFAFSPDGQTLATTNYWEATAELIDISTGTRKAAFPRTSNVMSLAFSPDGQTLATGSRDGYIYLWELKDILRPARDTQTQTDTGIQPYEREIVKLIYFRPSDRPSRQGIDRELDTLIRWPQYFFAEQMQDYGRKTFAFETDADGYAKVHHITGKFTDTYYHQGFISVTVVNEVAEQFDTSRDVFLIVVDVSSELINGACGVGGGTWKKFGHVEHWQRSIGGTAVIPASGVCINPSVTAHELGHVFGLEHDFRDDAYLMAYGTQERLSHCAAEWLDAHRFFNNDPIGFNETPTIAMLPVQSSGPDTFRLQFELTDTDGLHQFQLIVPTAANDPAPGIKLHSCRSLNAKNHTVEFLMTDANLLLDSEVTLQVIDATGNITKQAFSLVLAEDDTVVLASPALEFSAMQAPTETALLPNYPNPFNPETWIPYQLAAPCKVTIEIHAIDGSLVRVLSLGHKATGIYQNRTRAAYWDGRNNIGEPVASGVYLYTITAGEFNATRKMMIRK